MHHSSIVRTLSCIVGCLAGWPGMRGCPGSRWQDKSRELRHGRMGEERRNVSSFARGAVVHGSLQAGATALKIRKQTDIARTR
jgi:hypothetical protein